LPKLSPISWKDLVKRLRKLGFEGPYEGGKHPFMIKGDLTLTIPNPHRGDIKCRFAQTDSEEGGRNMWRMDSTGVEPFQLTVIKICQFAYFLNHLNRIMIFLHPVPTLPGFFNPKLFILNQ